MLKQTLKSVLITSAFLAMPVMAAADTANDVTTSSNYELISGDISNYAYPDGKNIKIYQSIKIAIPLDSNDYYQESDPQTSIAKGSPDHTYVLKLTSEGQSKVNQKLKNLPKNYEVVQSSKSVMGQYVIAREGTKNETKSFTTGANPKEDGREPTVSNVMYLVTLTNNGKTIDSTKQFQAVKKSANNDQKSIQETLGKLSKAQTEFLTPGTSTLSVKAKNINTNTDVKTAQSQSKSKIVNLDALKLAKKADKVEKQKQAASNHAKLVKNIIIGGIIIAVAAVIGGITYFIKKHNQKEEA